jgi:hypothetical protein
MITKLWLGSLAMLALTVSVRADTTLRYTVEGECPTIADTIEISGNLVRANFHTENGDQSTVYDGLEDSLTTLLPAQKKYVQIDADDDALDTADVVENSGKEAADPLQKIRSMMQGQCPDPEKNGSGCAAAPDMHSMLRNIAADQPQFEMRDTGHKKTVAGVDCNVVEVLQDKVKKREVCYALVSELTIPADDREGLGHGLKVMTRYGDARGGVESRFVSSSAQTDPSHGIPVAQTCFDPAGQALGQSTMGISQQAIAPDRFDIPADYTKMAMPDNPSGN